MGECGGKERIQSDGRRQEDYDNLKAYLIQQRRRAVTCDIAILREEKGVLIGVV